MAAKESARRKKPCDIVIRNGYVITVDKRRTIYATGAIAITGGRIAAIGRERDVLAAWEGKRIFDAQGAVVHPGFIDAHVHVVHGTCRGVFDGSLTAGRLTFADWKADVTDEDEFDATALASVEALRRGFTGFIEPGSIFEPDAAAKAAEAVGVRALLAGCYLWDNTDAMKYLGALDSKRLYRRAPGRSRHAIDQLGSQLYRNKDRDALVRGYVSVYGLATASDALEIAAKRLAAKHKVPFHQHEAYIPAATAADTKALGTSRMRHLAEIGVLDRNATFVHMTALDAADERVVKKTGVSIVWCPQAYMQSAGFKHHSRIPRLYKDGVNVTLGTDGTMDAAIGDAGYAAYYVAAGLGEPITAGDVVEMQSIRAAKVAGLDGEVGSLEAGKRADIVIRAPNVAESYPAVNPLHHLALMGNSGNVDTVLVNGQVVWRGGRSTRIDEGQVFARAKASVERRMKRLGLKPAIAWPVVR